MSRFADLLLGRRRAALVLVLLATALAAAGATRLGFDDLPRGIFRADDEASLLLGEVQQQFGADDNDLVLVLERDDWFTPEGARALRAAESGARAVPGVGRVDGLAGVPVIASDGVRPLLPEPDADAGAFASAREHALRHPFAGGNLISADGRTALVVARLSGGDLTVDRLRGPFDAMRALARELEREHGARAWVTGVPAFRVVIYDVIRRDQLVFTALGAAVCFAVALVVLRSLRACLVASLPPILGSLWALGAIGLAGGKVDLLGSVLPVLCILIAFTDSVHLVAALRGELARGRSIEEAVRRALAALLTPCFLTSLTTAIGLGSLALGSVPMIQRFGVQAACGVLIVFVAVVTTLPLLALALRPEGRVQGAPDGRIAAIFRRVTARPRAVAAAGVLLTAAMGLASLRLVPENRLDEAVPHDAEVFAGLRAAERAFGGLLPLYALVEWGAEAGPLEPDVLAAVHEVERVLGAEERLSRPYSYRGFTELVPSGPAGAAALAAALASEPARALLRADLSRALVVTRLPDLGTLELRPLFERVEAGLAAVEERHPKVEVRLTGTDVVARRNVNRMIADLARGLGAAAVLIFGVIAIEFRSLRLGLLSLPPNVFPLACVGALLVVLGRPLQMASAVLFTLLLGLAVDDTIHLLARVRRERLGPGDARDAICRAGGGVGAAILTTTVVLVAGFSVLLASSVPTNRLFALLLIVGLTAALIGDLVLLPALLVLFPGGSPRPGPACPPRD